MTVFTLQETLLNFSFAGPSKYRYMKVLIRLWWVKDSIYVHTMG